MSHNIFLQKFRSTNKNPSLHINDRYFKISTNQGTLSNRLNSFNKNINNNKNNNNKNISEFNSKTISISEVIKKIENLKHKYNQINLQKKINSKMTYNKILYLKNKYFKSDKKDTNLQYNSIKNVKNNNKLNSYSLYKIESTDKISMINKSWNKNSNLIIQTKENINENIFRKNGIIRLQKSNEINYQINSTPNNNSNNINIKNKFNIDVYKTYSNENNKNKRDEFLDLDKKINSLLNENQDSIDNDNNTQDLYKTFNNRFNSKHSIKERIVLLTDVKKKIKKIYNNSYEENEKTHNSSLDSQITLGFKHIKPIIKKENFFNDYLKDEEPRIENETISKPVLIRSLPRPKLNVPKYPSFFNK